MAGIERIPPQNTEAEQSLLGSLLIEPDSMAKVGDKIRAEDFYRDSHRIVFETMIDLFTRHHPIDLLTMGNRLEEKGLLTRIGGRAALVELSNAVPTAAHITHYAEIVQKKGDLAPLA